MILLCYVLESVEKEERMLAKGILEMDYSLWITMIGEHFICLFLLFSLVICRYAIVGIVIYGSSCTGKPKPSAGITVIGFNVSIEDI